MGPTQAPLDAPRVPELSVGHRAVAAGTGAALAAASLVHFGLGARGWISLAFVTALCALATIDLEHRVIPNRIVLPAAAAILAAQVAFFPDRTIEWLVAGAGAAGILLLPAAIKPGSVGIGDAKLALLLGVGLGREVITGLFLGSLAAVPVGLWMLARGGLAARKQSIPLGPFLAAGGVLALFVGQSL